MKKRAESQPALLKKINTVFQFNILKDGKTASTWTADMRPGGSVYNGEPQKGKAQCILILKDQDMVDLATGKLNGQQAFMTGKLKIKGNMMLAQKLGDLFNAKSKL